MKSHTIPAWIKPAKEKKSSFLSCPGRTLWLFVHIFDTWRWTSRMECGYLLSETKSALLEWARRAGKVCQGQQYIWMVTLMFFSTSNSGAIIKAPRLCLLPWMKSWVSKELYEPVELIQSPVRVLRGNEHLLHLSRDVEISTKGALQELKWAAWGF